MTLSLDYIKRFGCIIAHALPRRRRSHFFRFCVVFWPGVAYLLFCFCFLFMVLFLFLLCCPSHAWRGESFPLSLSLPRLCRVLHPSSGPKRKEKPATTWHDDPHGVKIRWRLLRHDRRPSQPRATSQHPSPASSSCQRSPRSDPCKSCP